jgi:hypothetical protein
MISPPDVKNGGAAAPDLWAGPYQSIVKTGLKPCLRRQKLRPCCSGVAHLPRFDHGVGIIEQVPQHRQFFFKPAASIFADSG